MGGGEEEEEGEGDGGDAQMDPGEWNFVMQGRRGRVCVCFE